MSIKFACSCGKAYKVPEKFAGKRVKCKQCGEAIRVPSESETSVQSSRAAAVSKRSVMGGSQRVDQEDDDEEMDDEEDEAPRPSKTSSKSSKPAPAGASARKPAVTSARVDAKRKGKQVAAYGAAAKGNTLLNYAGVRADLLSYVVDASPHKQGRFLPGSRIPVVNEAHLREARPDYVLILPWNLREEITAQLAYIREWGGQFVTAVPELVVS